MTIAAGIQFIYFDFDNVLASRAQNRAILVAAQLGLLNAAVLRHFYMHGFRDDPQLLGTYRSISTVDDEVEFYAAAFVQFMAQTGVVLSAERAHAAAQAFVNVPFVTDKYAAAVLRQLAQTYTLGILTNGLPSRHRDIERSGLGEFFAVTVVTCDYGVEKPALAIYEKASKVAQLPPKQLALVDDEETNLSGADQAGYGQSLLFTPAFWQQVTQA